MLRALVVWSIVVAGCAADRADIPEAPLSCNQAVTHYYAVGCAFAIPYDPPNMPEPIGEHVFMNTCLAIRDQAPQCWLMLAALLECAAEATPGDCRCQALWADIHC